ncbi:hypothetical protein F5882DRAFT_439451 [Hyaloscypha sp. PMI_1271]|nr:hypothetical protein F5882DRAFT_439451 [Hyaloscypha sp. PMI_1271]
MSPLVPEVDIGPQTPPYEFKLDEQIRETNEQILATQDAREQARSSPRPGSIHIPFLDRLQALPEVREIPWRRGQDLPPDKSIDSPRVQQRGAILLSTRGAVAPIPCEHCAAGYGRFSSCITLDQWFQGACSGCIFTSKAENPKPPKKRKRRSAPSQMQSAVEPSHTSSFSPVASQAISLSTDLDTLLQAEIAREQSSGQRNIKHTEKKQYKRHNPSQPNVARARGPIIGADPSPYSNEARKFIPDASSSRDPATIPTERPVLPWPVLQALSEEKKSVTSGSTTLQYLSGYSKTSSTPMIDTLPKAKQRQIFSVISGLQGGIDHLQKQLDALKALLGINDEDETEPR